MGGGVRCLLTYSEFEVAGRVLDGLEDRVDHARRDALVLGADGAHHRVTLARARLTVWRARERRRV